MGGGESQPPGWEEPPLEYHPSRVGILIPMTNRETVSGRQFDWGGCLLKSNGGAQRSPQHGWQSCVECKGIRGPDCERDTSSRRESGA